MTPKRRPSTSGSRPKPGGATATTHAPAPAKVGIFWWHRNRLLADAVRVEDGDETAWSIDSAANHVDLWPQFQKQHPALRNLEYEEVPRGRVVFSKEAKLFCVYMDAQLHRERIKTALRRAFGLTGRKVRFATDPHYTTDKTALERLWNQT